jgi:hypothetical protein
MSTRALFIAQAFDLIAPVGIEKGLEKVTL